MRIVLFAHGGSGNHGCEALVRTIPQIIKKEYKDAEFLVATFAKEEDIKYGVENIEFLSYSPFSSTDPRKYVDKFIRTVFKSGVMRKKVISPVIEDIRSDDVWLYIGGDNYSYPGVIPFDIINVHNAVIKKNAKCILWGCSINKSNLSGTILQDLKKYDAIVARESITYNYLKEAGISDNKLYLFPDSAFTLQTSENIGEQLPTRPYIGINISPIVLGKYGHNQLILENYKELVRHIIKNTNYSVVLIPHVVWDNSDDRKSIQLLFDEFADSNRVTVVHDQSACGLKKIISLCEIFVGARTHATIAAYSSGVPTLVIGYSVKSKGIAKDIFGSNENYVVACDELSEKEDLTKWFEKLNYNKEAVRKYLKNNMPQYIESAWKSVSVLEQFTK